jgi:hypothetical protein
MGLGPTWMILIGGCHLAQMTILGIANATMGILNFPLQIWNLKKWVWTVLIGGCHLTCSWRPNDYFGYRKSYSKDIKFPSSYLESPQERGLGPTWTVPIGGCHLVLPQSWLTFFKTKKGINLLRKFAKIVRIFEKIDDSKNQRVI